MRLVDVKTLEKIKQDIAEAPEKTKSYFTKIQALGYLKEELAVLLEKNYTHDDVIAFLKERGLTVSLSTLKSFIKAAFPKDTERKTTRKSASKK